MSPKLHLPFSFQKLSTIMGNCNARSKTYGSTANNLPGLESSDVFDTIVHEGPILGLTYSPDGKKIISCSDDQRIAMTDIESLENPSGSSLSYLVGHSKAVNRVICNGEKVYSCSRDLSVKTWDVSTQRCTMDIPNAHELNIVGLATNHFNASVIYSGSRDYSVKAWDVESGTCTATYSAPRNIVTTLQSSPTDANLLYQGSEDLFVRVWDVRSPTNHAPAQVISGYVYFPVSMDVRADGQVLATGTKGFDSVGCSVKVWDLRNIAQPLADFAGHNQDVVGCKFSAEDPDLILSNSKDGSVRAWDTKLVGSDRQSCACYPHTGKLVSCLAVPPSGSAKNGTNEMVIGANDGTLTFASFAGTDGAKAIKLNGSTKPYFQQEDSLDE